MLVVNYLFVLMSDSHRNLCLGTACVCVATILQFAALCYLGILDVTSISVLIAGMISLLFSVIFYTYRQSSIIRCLILTTTAGGLGMMVGMGFDGVQSQCANCSYSILGMIPTWMTVGMFVCCLPACCIFCKLHNDCMFSSFRMHLVASIPMLAGMLAGAYFLTTYLSSLLHSFFLGHYFAMLFGMVIGTLFGMLPVVKVKRRVCKTTSSALT